MHVSIRVLSTPNKRDMGQAAPQGLWFDIVRNAGATYGSRTDFS